MSVNIFLKILNLYINSSIHVALAVVSFTCITYLDFNLKIDNYILVFVFSSTIIAYTFVKYVPFLVQYQNRISNSLKLIFALSIAAILPAFFSLFYIQVNVLLFIFFLGMLTLLYVLPFLPKAKNLRDISGLKIFIIALVWTGTTVILPLLSSELKWRLLELEKMTYIISRFLIVIALIVPFEIRDMKLDHIYIKTLPQVLGVFKSKILAVCLILLSTYLLSRFISESYVYIIVHLIIMLLVIFSRRQKTFYYTAFIVEAVPVVWLLLKLFLG